MMLYMIHLLEQVYIHFFSVGRKTWEIVLTARTILLPGAAASGV